MRTFVIGVLVCLLLAGGVLFYLYGNLNFSNTTSSVTIKTAKTYWPGQYWKEIAYEKGWFKEAGLTVELVDGNKDYYQSLQDAADGKIDSNAFPPFDFLQYIGKGADLVAVINTDNSNGIDAVIGSSNITTMQDLKGKRVAVPKGTFAEYLLTVALERYGLTTSDITMIDTQAEKTHEALVDGTADAAVTYEPFVSETIKNAGANKLFDTSRIVGINSSVEAFQRTFIESHPDLIQKYVAVWHKTTTFIHEHPNEAYAIIADNYGVTVDEVAELAKVDTILGLRDNKISFAYAAGYESLHGAFKRMNRFMVENKLIDTMLDDTSYLDSRFTSELR